MMTLIDAAGLQLAPHDNFKWWKPGQISNIAGIQRCFREYGAPLTGRALGILAGAFDGQVLRYGGTIFAGLWPMMAVFDDDAPCDDDLLQLVLSGQEQVDWIREIATVEADRGIHRRSAAMQVLRAAYDEAIAAIDDEEAA